MIKQELIDYILSDVTLLVALGFSVKHAYKLYNDHLLYLKEKGLYKLR